jgi:nickel/cobalt transporter (NicO) family protein
MWTIFIGSLILSLIHASIPNHWLPLIAVAKAEKWKTKETLNAILITGFSHTLSTIIIGIVVGFIGFALSEYYHFIMRYAAPAILFLVGAIYIFLDFHSGHHHHHHHHHGIENKNNFQKSNKNKIALLFSLSLAMFLTPCVEIEVYYFQAGTIGWWGIFIVSAVYLFITLAVMMTLVFAGLEGTQTIRSHFLEHHEKLITGIVLVSLGLLNFFIEF